MRLILFVMLLLVSMSMFYKKTNLKHLPTIKTTIPSTKLFAGEVHFSRIPVQYWEHRIQTIKALGMNALSVYVMWNYHEVEQGKWDFSTENKNLPLFLDLATKHNMSVLLRPGPYVCAEWDFGGLPSYLLENKTSVSLRSTNQVYMAAVKRYFTAIAPIVIKYDSKNGGPIILLQIQNEYGSFGSDMTYINGLRQIWKDLGVTIDQYHADPTSALSKSHWPGGNMGVNNGVSEADYTTAKKLDPSVYIFGGEIYPGWLTHWGENWATKDVNTTVKEFTFLCANNHSFSMYMVHGGSNFGFTAGANSKTTASDYEGHITSYDYDAPINEQGSVGAKYSALRALFSKYVQWLVPDPPAPLHTISIPPFTPTAYATLLDNLPTPISLANYTHFQSAQLKMYNQGIVVYQTDLPAGKYSINVVVHDYAIVWVDGEILTKLDRQVSKNHTLAFECKGTCMVRVIVEAMGHVNFGQMINSDRKGLIQFSENTGKWLAYKLPLEPGWVSKISTLKAGTYPVFAKYTFDLSETGDTFFNMGNYQKGYVWVNGRNLGRYWNKGPQKKLFCPGVWLKNKGNELIVLELVSNQLQSITGDQTLKQ